MKVSAYENMVVGILMYAIGWKLCDYGVFVTLYGGLAGIWITALSVIYMLLGVAFMGNNKEVVFE